MQTHSTPPPRQPSEIIQAILKNLEYAADVAMSDAGIAARAQDFKEMRICEAIEDANREAIALIRTEAASILETSKAPHGECLYHDYGIDGKCNACGKVSP